MKIVVGLGNPGRRYAATRHNLGFLVVEALQRTLGASRPQKLCRSLVAEARVAEGKVLLVQPQTYMNNSGEAVRSLVDWFKLSTADLLVVCDDFALPVGTLRLRRSGSHGGHNGLRSVIAHLGTTDFTRLRIGVGAPPEGVDPAEYVLQAPPPAEAADLAEAVARAAEATLTCLECGPETAMHKYNSRVR